MKALVPLFAALTFIQPAWSNESLSGSVTDMGFTLVDLDPNDGITPAITFNPGTQYNSAVVAWLSSLAPGPGQQVVRNYGDGNLGNVSATLPGAFALANASVIGDGTLGGTTMQAACTVTSTYYVQGCTAGADLYSGGSQSFELTAHTRVIFTAQASLKTEYSYGGDPVPPYNDSMFAMARIAVDAEGGTGDGPQYNRDEIQAGMSSYDAEGPLSVAFENSAGRAIGGKLDYTLSLDAESAAVVPEPATAACLAGGLLLLGWRRRSRRSQP